MFTLQISNKEMLRALSAVSKVISTKNSLSILDNALISEGDGKFYVTGSNQQTELTVSCDIKVLNGQFENFCVPAFKMQSMLATLGDQVLNIDVDNSNNHVAMHIAYMTGEFDLPGNPAQEYPRMNQDGEAIVGYNLPTDTMTMALKSAMQNCAADELRMVMNGVCMDAHMEGVHLVASDGHKLYSYNHEAGIPFLTEGNLTDPKQTIPVILNKAVIPAVTEAFRGTENVSIVCTDRQIRLNSNNAWLVTTRIEGNYPKWQSIIPSREMMSQHLCANVKELTTALKRVLLCASVATELVKLEYKDGNLVLTSEDIDFSLKAKETVALTDAVMQEGFTIGIKGNALITHLGYVTTDNVRLEFAEPSKPIILKEDAEKGTPLLCLLMPMLLNA